MADCYSCKYRRNVPGSAHSSCTKITGNNAITAMALVWSGRKVPGLSFNKHGVDSGWCNWPLDFDPIWVTCKYHQPVDEPHKE